MTDSSDQLLRPPKDLIVALANSAHIKLTSEEANSLPDLVDNMLKHFDIVESLSEPEIVENSSTVRESHRPTRAEDPHNSFITKCFIKARDSGRLTGKRIAVKDNVSVLGIPMTNGSLVCQGYVPSFDATVVTRVLDEGAIIVGKTNMDDLSYSCTSETSAYGPVENPMNPEFSPGGSSSGSAAAVANGDCDLAISVDQGGSARIPASWCGVVSIKASHGLVPSFGISYIDHTMDYVCPTARNMKDLATLLETMAGEDDKDPQWVKGPVQVEKYSDHLKNSDLSDLSDVKIGVVSQAMNLPFSQNDVLDSIEQAVTDLSTLGADVGEASVGLFARGISIWTALVTLSSTLMIELGGDGYWHGGYYNTKWNEFFGKASRERSNNFSPPLKLATVVGKYMRDKYYGIHHSKAQNLRRELRRQIDQALSVYDILALPTTPMKPLKLKRNLTFKESATRGANVINNCCPFNLSGHPALTIPCAMREGLPVGLQLVAKIFDERVLFRVGAAFENSFDWKHR